MDQDKGKPAGEDMANMISSYDKGSATASMFAHRQK